MAGTFSLIGPQSPMHAPMWSMLLLLPRFFEGHTFTISCLCSFSHNSPVYVRFLHNKHWPVGWGVIEVHSDEPNLVCPFVNAFQGSY